MDRQMNIPKFLCNVTEVHEYEKGLDVQTDIRSLVGSGYKPGDVLELHKPDGTISRAESGLVHYSLEPAFALANPDYEPPITFSLKGLRGADVPIGTEIWTVVQHQSTEFKNAKFERIDKV